MLPYLRHRFGLPIDIADTTRPGLREESFRIADLRVNLTAIHRALAREADARDSDSCTWI